MVGASSIYARAWDTSEWHESGVGSEKWTGPREVLDRNRSESVPFSGMGTDWPGQGVRAMLSGSGPREPHDLGKEPYFLYHRLMAIRSTTDSAALGVQTERVGGRAENDVSSPRVRRRRLLV
jgi:hypothetical protein